jgi:Gene product 88
MRKPNANRFSDANYNWLTQNSKMAKMSGVKTFNWGIPAYRSADGFKTCPNAAACAKGCYATMGAYLFSNVTKVFEQRLKLSQAPRFVEIINSEIKRRNVQRLRVHDSGDFYNVEYLDKWIKIIEANPTTQFYAYTKMISVFKKYAANDRIPDNFVVIYSYGGTEDKLIDKKNDRHSWVFSSVEALQVAGYADAHVDDSVALGENGRIGLVYHGTKNIENTDWGRVKAA